MTAQDHLSPDQFYHVSDPANRESIAKHGLRTDFSDDEDMHGEGAALSVYVSKTPREDRSAGQDTWAVNMHGLSMEQDIEPGDYRTDSSVSPDRVRLHKAAS
jgi:hypothetical protein